MHMQAEADQAGADKVAKHAELEEDKARHVASRLISIFDANQDDQIDGAEFKRLMASFDTTGDGLLNRAKRKDMLHRLSTSH